MDEGQIRTAEGPAQAGHSGAAMTVEKPTFWKRRPTIISGSAALAVLLYFGLYYLVDSFTHESTDDAFLDATAVSVAPRVAGQIKRLAVTDNQQVKAGDLLAEIDPRDFEVALAQKRTARAAADANVKLLLSSIEMLSTQVGTAEATAKQSEAQAEANQATADRADADLKRARELIQGKIISPQEFDTAKAAAAAADATLNAGREKAASDRSKISETRAELDAGRRAWERALAQSDQASVDVQQADLNLSYTRITAPQDGRVTERSVEQGNYVQVGQRLLVLVAGDVYVVANFKETQLKTIRPGQHVRISVDSVGGREFSGRVDSIQASSGAAFSLLPPENAVGNYVKVVQRVPVKILFDKPVEAAHVLGPGMSVVPSVRVSDVEIPDFVIALGAALLAGAAGWLWWRKANEGPSAANPAGVKP